MTLDSVTSAPPVVRDWCQCCGSPETRPGVAVNVGGVVLSPVCSDCDQRPDGYAPCACGPDHDCRANGCDDCEACNA